jgi:hypothetical protein
MPSTRDCIPAVVAQRLAMTTTWTPLPLATFDALPVTWLYTAGSANTGGHDWVLLACLVCCSLSVISQLAILIARRRRALIGHGLAYGFLEATDKNVPLTGAATASPHNGNGAHGHGGKRYGASGSHGPVAAVVLSEGCLPATASEVIPARPWDDGCAMIDEGAPLFTTPMETVELMEFYTRPLFTQLYAASYFLYRQSILVLDGMKAAVAFRLVLRALYEPCSQYRQAADDSNPASFRSWDDLFGEWSCWAVHDAPAAHVDSIFILLGFGLSFAFMMWRARSPNVPLYLLRTAKAVLWVVFFGYVAWVAGQNTAEARSAFVSEATATKRRTREATWVVALNAASILFEFHGSTHGAFNSLPAKTSATSGNKLDRQRYTFGAAGNLAVRVLGFYVSQLVMAVLVIALISAAYPEFDGDVPLSTLLSWGVLEGFTVFRCAWSSRLLAIALSLLPIVLVLPGLAPDTFRAAGLLRYMATGKPRSWGVGGIALSSVFVSVVLNLAIHTRHWVDAWVTVLRLCGTLCTFVFPFILWRFSRHAARRLGIPRRLDDALRLTPTISRIATAAGAAIFIATVAQALGLGYAPHTSQ